MGEPQHAHWRPPPTRRTWEPATCPGAPFFRTAAAAVAGHALPLPLPRPVKQPLPPPATTQAASDDEPQAAAVAWVVRWLLSGEPGVMTARMPLSDILGCAGTK